MQYACECQCECVCTFVDARTNEDLHVSLCAHMYICIYMWMFTPSSNPQWTHGCPAAVLENLYHCAVGARLRWVGGNSGVSNKNDCRKASIRHRFDTMTLTLTLALTRTLNLMLTFPLTLTLALTDTLTFMLSPLRSHSSLRSRSPQPQHHQQANLRTAAVRVSLDRYSVRVELTNMRRGGAE